MVAISAHGPRTGTIEAYARALETGAEYVEFDIRRTADGELAAFHDPRTRQGEALAAISYPRLCELAGHPVPRVADLMTLIAGKATGHLDLKDTGGEDGVVEMALDILGPGTFVVTTLEDQSVAAIKARFPAVPAALSLGRDLNGVPRPGRAATRLSELFPMRRLRACRADWAAVHRRLAAAGADPVPPGRDQDHDLDRRQGRRDEALAGRPAGRRADHEPARRRGSDAFLAARG
jgi:glycerophosphoryl diester phosphodiesterase